MPAQRHDGIHNSGDHRSTKKRSSSMICNPSNPSAAPEIDQHHLWSSGHAYRTSRKNERISSTNSSGCSKAAKCPPRSSSFQWRISRKRFCAHRRDGRWSSLGKIEQPVGTATVSVVRPEIHSFTCLMLSQ